MDKCTNIIQKPHFISKIYKIVYSKTALFTALHIIPAVWLHLGLYKL